jgi:hypothetical protein
MRIRRDTGPTPRWTALGLIAVLAILLLPLFARAQGQIQSLTIAGTEGSIPIKRLNGRSYVAVDALTELAGGTLSYRGNQITLTLPAAASAAEAKPGLSRDFLRAAIDEITAVREWHTALAGAIENQNPVTTLVTGPFETDATRDLHLAQVAAATEDDRQAAALITNEFQKMKQLSDQYLAQRAAATYIHADALGNDPLDQSLLECNHSLSAMVAGGRFSDNGSCR